MQREKPPEWREKQKGSRGIRRGQRYRLVFQFPIREHNLDQSLLLDDVANKAGYTKWYFQRLFKKVTGVTLASYIRARRLTKAAVELRLTKKTILEIALKYQFDSQQSFTRRVMTPTY